MLTDKEFNKRFKPSEGIVVDEEIQKLLLKNKLNEDEKIQIQKFDEYYKTKFWFSWFKDEDALKSCPCAFQLKERKPDAVVVCEECYRVLGCTDKECPYIEKCEKCFGWYLHGRCKWCCHGTDFIDPVEEEEGEDAALDERAKREEWEQQDHGSDYYDEDNDDDENDDDDDCEEITKKRTRRSEWKTGGNFICKKHKQDK
jgi:hypothetical protein